MIVLGWFLFQVVLAALPVGRVISGLPVRGSQKLKYRCNGSIALVLSLVAMAVGHAYFKVNLAVVHTLWLQLISAATVLSLVLSVVLYIQARKAKPSAVAPEATGNILVDFWVGRELNPRIRTFDWKLFMIRFAYLSMLAVDVIFLVEAYTGKSGMSNYPFLLVAGVQVLHCAVQVLNEDMFLTMPDITKMGLGFMFIYGFMLAGPFGSSIQARYLLEHPQTPPLWALASVALLNLFGFILYQSTVSQNARFTRNPYDPTLSHLESMPTSVPGERLLVSGMWGMCRHPLYFAELVLIYAWSLACGFSTPLVYVFPVLMTLLCMDSVRKEEAEASKKYGSTWDRCCQRVKYKLIPFVY
ncbi:lamin-B receptor-like [Lingula anatina]|uniref:Lamin-B receptor-like n=1 Tax=Lingula anatina TaxID=7574 RepID=A0A1S3HVY9_LINAN|nr:lamin-B receptor-like [Lingula anatina]|eukprot:XP_013389229.1 lamin-B receptor-like [Lingula anatina]